MKKFALLFAVCLISLGFAPARGDYETDAVRAAKRNSATIATAVSSRQKSDGVTAATTSTTSRTSGGSTVATKSESQNATGGRTVVNSRTAVTAPAAARTAATTQPSVVTRTATNQTRTATTSSTQQTSTAPRTGTTQSTAARTAAIPRATSVARNATSTAKNAASRNKQSSTLARSAVNSDAIDAIMNKDYKKCRSVFYECMDEFCANKDTQIKRCACSSRVHDFDRTKTKLSNVEDKMLTFNERLLTVNMEKEDALAISQATEGELAYQTDDKSESKKILDEIAKKLKTSTADTDLTRNLSAISLSLDMDSAFDNIDSFMGASTATKEGTALYNAALPVCRDMVAEVCDEDGVNMAVSGYLMAIEQDCNTVAKAYETMQEQALEKVREGSALLDISRLDIHQKRNSDDILTCKKKMLDMMSSSSVCGTDLGKCLDTTGKYIDPSTGEAFLTEYLVDLGRQISRPEANQKWTDAPGNNMFVKFLNSKKKYLEPAMENCQDISDQVWDDFIEDALAQIKLAQERKLEDMRQGCTSLTTQCLSDTAKSIEDFDARALSIFGVSADRTVNEMCAGIKTACTALLEYNSADADWVGGMTEIATDKTYDTIIQTCREVGKACIIQICKSISGNFGLCENIEKSVNRKSVINRISCWNEVLECVKEAGQDSVDRIMAKFNKTPTMDGGNFYEENYGTKIETGKDIVITNTPDGASCTPNITYKDDGSVQEAQNCVRDICMDEQCGAPGKVDCATCRLAEKIWGNCEFFPQKELESTKLQNMIKSSKSDFETLLAWFAKNTGTTDRIDSCMDTTCPAGQRSIDGECMDSGKVTSDSVLCAINEQFNISENPKWTNCCKSEDGNTRDDYGNCCANVITINYGNFPSQSGSISICAPTSTPSSGSRTTAVFGNGASTYYKSGSNILFCTSGNTTGEDVTANYPNGQTIRCAGDFIVIAADNNAYISPEFNIAPAPTTDLNTYPANRYNIQFGGDVCILNFQTGKWGTVSGGTWTENQVCNKVNNNEYPTSGNHMFISY